MLAGRAPGSHALAGLMPGGRASSTSITGDVGWSKEVRSVRERGLGKGRDERRRRGERREKDFLIGLDF